MIVGWRRHLLVDCMSLALGSFIVPMPSLAQTSARDALKYKDQRAPRLPEKDMTNPEPLPGVPPYSGQCKFQSGHTYETPMGTTYREYWNAREDRQHVLEWYKGALQSYGYKIVSSSVCNITASKGYDIVEVAAFNQPHDSAYRSQITIQSYHKKN